MGMLRTWLIQKFLQLVFKFTLGGKFVENKQWYKSKTIWSMIVSILVAILELIDTVSGMNLLSTEIVTTVLTLAGALGIYGRTSATTGIK